jgi:2-polyprenyl-6-methoxyphenol hydroxylase-like FAD-dependent oxidoreductase
VTDIRVLQAIIIGGGAAGLAAAIRLKTQNGINVVLYEIRSKPTTLGGAINIPSNGLRLLKRLGLYDELVARGSSASHLNVHSLRGPILVDVDMAGWSREKVGYGFMRVLRADLMDVLLNAAKEHGIPIHFGARMTKIKENERDVTVSFANNTTDTADLLLGCDGIHSAVRTFHVSPETSPEYTGIANMFAIIPTTSLSEPNRDIVPALHMTLTSNGLLGAMPCTASGDQVYWFYSCEVSIPGGGDNREGWEAFGKNAVDGFKENVLGIIQEAQGGWANQLREIIQKTETIKFYPIYKMPQAVVWSTKRCLLLGDAAHAMPPHAGQGTSMALEDVFLLSRALEGGWHTLDEVFREYEAVRRPRVEAIGRASAENGEVRKSTSPLGLMMKETVLGAGFWLYKMAGLQKFGIGMNQKDFVYDVMAEPIWNRVQGNGNDAL